MPQMAPEQGPKENEQGPEQQEQGQASRTGTKTKKE